MKLLKPYSNLCLYTLLILMCLYLYGCLEFKPIEQPSSVLPGELFTVLVEATVERVGPTGYPIFGICLPVGWTIPGDTIALTGVSQGSIIYDPNLSLEQENLSPAPEGYYWWLGSGSIGNLVAVADTVFAEVPIQAGLQPGRYSLNYLLTWGFLVESAPSPYSLYRLSDAERSDQHNIEVVDEWTPRELNALPRGSSVVLTWLPPLEKEGLAGYRVYRDGELVYTIPADTTEILDEDLDVDAVYYYSVSVVYNDATEQLTPYKIEARIFSGGTGEPNDPYQVALADQLFHLADHRHLWDKAYVLVNDIDLHPDQTPRAPFSQAVIHHFTGIFDGNDHTISNLMITGGKYLGLFGRLESSAQVFDLNVIEVNMNGSERFVGGLAGYNDGSISGCYTTGIVNGSGDSTGGLVGSNHGSIVSSYSAGTVSGGESHGGLVGSNGGSIVSSYSTGTVIGGRSVGGLVGSNDRGSSITASYSTGTVSGTDRVGGLVGENDGNIATSYSTGVVTGMEGVGGLVGWNEGSITTSFWDMETSGFAVSNGGVGLTTEEMMGPYMLGLNGFANDPNWVLDVGRDYPRLAWEGMAGQSIPEPIIDWLSGQGTEEEPYRVDTADQLIFLSRASGLWDKHFILGADIDLDPNLPDRQVFSQAVIQVFSGVFDGSDHTISHLTIEGSRFLGLFGQTGSGARISNLALEAVYVSGNFDVGGLVGSNAGGITASYSTGTIRGTSCVGGLVGDNDGSITTSYSIGTVVSRGGSVGGLVGTNSGNITSSYNIGSVSGRGNWSGGTGVGGLVGTNSGGITASYSTGTVSGDRSVGGLVGGNDGSITSSFWDIQTSGQITSEDGTGLNTTQMQTASTFLDAGWDFVDETANGTGDIWSICEGRGYPRLRWEKLYVDDDAPDDPGPGNPQISDPLENGRQAHPFDTIQEAIDFAPDYLTILVSGGVYGEPIDFKGKAITVKSRSDVAVLEAPGDYAVSFFSVEEPNSVLQNFIIRNSLVGIYVSGSSPTIRNLTVVDNEYGIAAYTWAQPDISNCIFWNNSDLDLFQCEARYSCIENGDPGEGNLSADPLFINADNGDYHLLSAGWCWSTETESWTYDDITSPCIDAGDPDSPLGEELLSVPRDPDNEYGVNLRINMGAYGGTAQASMPPLGWTPWNEN